MADVKFERAHRTLEIVGQEFGIRDGTWLDFTRLPSYEYALQFARRVMSHRYDIDTRFFLERYATKRVDLASVAHDLAGKDDTEGYG
jgi:hypothetical protein